MYLTRLMVENKIKRGNLSDKKKKKLRNPNDLHAVKYKERR